MNNWKFYKVIFPTYSAIIWAENEEQAYEGVKSFMINTGESKSYTIEETDWKN